MIWNKHIPIVYACKNEEGKLYAMYAKVHQSYNLLAFVNCIPNVIHVNVCDSYKQAREIAENWNESYKKNGTYLFS